MTDAPRKLPIYRQSLAGTLLRAREAVMGSIRPILREAGVTEQQWRVLRVLVDEGACDTSTLAQSALLHAPSLTRILRECVERGLVSRDLDPDDARRSIITITAEGARLVDAVASRTILILDGYGAQFGRERLAALQGELRALAESIDGPVPSDAGED